MPDPTKKSAQQHIVPRTWFKFYNSIHPFLFKLKVLNYRTVHFFKKEWLAFNYMLEHVSLRPKRFRNLKFLYGLVVGAVVSNFAYILSNSYEVNGILYRNSF